MKFIRRSIKVSLTIAIALLLVSLVGMVSIMSQFVSGYLPYLFIVVYLIAVAILIFCIKAILDINQDSSKSILIPDRIEEKAIGNINSESEFLKAVIENIEDGIVACDKNGNLILFNKATEKIHGLPLVNLPPEDWTRNYNLYYPDGVTPLKMEDIPLFKAFHGQKVVNVEIVVAPLHKKRKIILVNGSRLDTVDGELLGAAVSMRDITAVKEAESKLNELISEDYFRELSDQIPIMIWKVNSQGLATYVNKSWINFTGLSFDESLYHGWIQSVHPDDREAELVNFGMSLKEHTAYSSKFRLRRKDGVYRWVLNQGNPLFNLEFEGYIGSLTDITEQELAQQATKLLMQKKDEFMSIASHELKTPITSMKASLQIVERLTANNPEIVLAHDFIQKANKHVNKITILVQDLLDITKIQAGKMQFNSFVFSIREVIQDSVDQIQQGLTSHKISVMDNDEIFVQADKHRLEQVITNFLSNAVKYSPDGKDILIKYKKEDENLYLSVTDFGIGIPDDKIPFIFDRFFRVQESSQKFSGLGLGLYITSEIINRHDGKIGVASEEGKGSTFWFSIPLNNDENTILADKYYING